MEEYKKINKQYRVIKFNYDTTDYYKELEYYLNHGWKLHGETSLFHYNGELFGLQPVVRNQIDIIQVKEEDEPIEAHLI